MKVFFVIWRRRRKYLVLESLNSLKSNPKKVNVLEKLQELLHFSLEVCLALCLFFGEFEPKYAYKRYAYKKRVYSLRNL